MKPEYIKPETVHKSVCSSVNYQAFLKDTLIYSYCNFISKELYVTSLDSGFKTLVFNLCSFIICYFIVSRPITFISIPSYLVLTLCLLIFVYSWLRYWYKTAEYKVRKLIKTDFSNLKCYSIKIDKRYLDFFNRPTIKVDKLVLHIDKFMYDKCRARSFILLYTVDNNVVFWYPTLCMNNLNLMIKSFNEIYYKIRFKDVFNYYKVHIMHIIGTYRVMLKEVSIYCKEIIKYIKRK